MQHIYGPFRCDARTSITYAVKRSFVAARRWGQGAAPAEGSLLRISTKMRRSAGLCIICGQVSVEADPSWRLRHGRSEGIILACVTLIPRAADIAEERG